MGGLVQTGKEKILPFRVPKEGVAGWRKLYEVLSFIFDKMGFKLSFDGMDGQEIPGGIHLKATPGASTGNNLICTGAGDGTGNFIIRVSSGTVLGLMPALDGTDLDAATPPSFTRTAPGTLYVYAAVLATLVDSHGFVQSYTVDEVDIGCGSSLPADVSDEFRGHILLATFVDGIRTYQRDSGIIFGFLEDDGTGTTSANLFYL